VQKNTEYNKQYQEAVSQTRQALQETLETDFLEPYKKPSPLSLSMLKNIVKQLEQILLLTEIYPEVEKERQQLRKKLNKIESFINHHEFAFNRFSVRKICFYFS